jgi:hypothetical protein
MERQPRPHRAGSYWSAVQQSGVATPNEISAHGRSCPAYLWIPERSQQIVSANLRCFRERGRRHFKASQTVFEIAAEHLGKPFGVHEIISRHETRQLLIFFLYMQGEYLILSEEQQKRSELIAKMQNDSIASQTVTSVFENLFTLLDDYRAVRQSFIPAITRSPVWAPVQQPCDEDSQRTQNADLERFQDSSIPAAVNTGPDTGMPPPRTGRAKRARKGTPSYHAGGTLSGSSQSYTLDHSIGVHSDDQFNEGYAEPISRESEAQGAGAVVEEAPKDSPDDHFHSIYSDISECVLSDPQVALTFASRPVSQSMFKTPRQETRSPPCL